MNDFKPGNVIVSECIIKSKDGRRSYDLKLQVHHIDIYESIMQATLYGELIITDAIGVRKGFPLIGEETLTLKFSTPSLKAIELDLRVFAITDIQQTENNKLEMYVLKVCSPELLTNASQIMAKRYSNQISSTVQNIISTELKSKKQVFIENTRGIDDHLVTDLAPLQVIDKLRLRAVSPKNASSSYCFYENPAGFHFVTLEGMIREGKKKIADKVFFYDDNIDVNIKQVRFRDILNYEQLVDQNSLDKIQAGSIKNTVTKFDMITGNLKIVEYKNEQYENVFVNTGDTPKTNTSKFHNEHGQTSAKTFLVPYSSEHDEDFIGEKVGILHGFVEKIAQNIMIMLIYGDSSITVGDVIACNFSLGTAIDTQKSTKQVTNNYLVAKVRHQITMSDRPVYLQSLELLNSSYDY